MGGGLFDTAPQKVADWIIKRERIANCTNLLVINKKE